MLLIARVLPSNLSNKYWELSFFSSEVGRNGIHWETLLNFLSLGSCRKLLVPSSRLWKFHMIPPPKDCWRRSFILPAGGLRGTVSFTVGPRKSPGGGPGSGAAHGSFKNSVVSNSKIGVDHDNMNGKLPNKDLTLFFNTSAACIINRT